jgi:hypothetical protein
VTLVFKLYFFKSSLKIDSSYTYITMYLIILLALLPIERSNIEKIKGVEINLEDNPHWVDHIRGYYPNECICNKRSDFADLYPERRISRIIELSLVLLSLVMSTVALCIAIN